MPVYPSHNTGIIDEYGWISDKEVNPTTNNNRGTHPPFP